MAKFTDLAIPDDGKLTHNIIHFARALRKAGLPIGPGRVLDAVRAVEAAGFSEKRDFFWTLHACFVSRSEHREIFGQIFRLYWRDPRYLEHMIAALVPSIRGVQEERKAQAAEKRAAEALLGGVDRPLPDMPDEEKSERIEIDASRTASSRERLRHLDFELMSGEEMIAARRMLSTLTLPIHPLRSRRTHPARHGLHPDWRATMRQALRRSGQIIDLCTRTHRTRWPNLVALCDISGSMNHYSRAVLHFLHAISNRKGPGWAKVHAFTFGTRLTNITRHLHHRDVDAALAAVGAQAQDWNGGTRIGACVQAFNRDWSRRVLSQGAVVLLITDGLDRDDPGTLAHAMDRLRLSARRLIWLNPLLRWDGFAPKVRGIQVMLPRVDSFRAGHNVASLEALAEALGRPEDMGEKARLMAALRAI